MIIKGRKFHITIIIKNRLIAKIYLIICEFLNYTPLNVQPP